MIIKPLPFFKNGIQNNKTYYRLHGSGNETVHMHQSQTNCYIRSKLLREPNHIYLK